MSEINNIKTTNQMGLNSTRNVNIRDSRKNEAAQEVQNSSISTDSVSLTNTATQLQSLQQALADAPVVDNNKVTALRAAIADGSYQVDATALAKNIIDFETNLA